MLRGSGPQLRSFNGFHLCPPAAATRLSQFDARADSWQDCYISVRNAAVQSVSQTISSVLPDDLGDLQAGLFDTVTSTTIVVVWCVLLLKRRLHSHTTVVTVRRDLVIGCVCMGCCHTQQEVSP